MKTNHWRMIGIAVFLFLALFAVLAAAGASLEPRDNRDGQGQGQGENLPYADYIVPLQEPAVLKDESQSVYFATVVNDGGQVDLPDSDGALEMGRYGANVTEVIKTKTDATAGHEVRVGEVLPIRRVQGIVADNALEVGKTYLFFTSYDGAREWHFETAEPMGDQLADTPEERDALRALYTTPPPYVEDTDPGVEQPGTAPEPETVTEPRVGEFSNDEVAEPENEFCPSDTPTNCTPDEATETP